MVPTRNILPILISHPSFGIRNDIDSTTHGLSGHKAWRSQINYSDLRNVRHATQTVTVTDDLITLFWLGQSRFFAIRIGSVCSTTGGIELRRITSSWLDHPESAALKLPSNLDRKVLSSIESYRSRRNWRNGLLIVRL